MNSYGVKTDNDNLMGPFASLEILYENMPETSGCDKCSEYYGETEKDWCCHLLTPSMYYVEFLYIWQHIKNTWSRNKKQGLIIRAIKNYLRNDLNKGCVFYDNECTVHYRRPFSCRMYCMTPQESWDARWQELEKMCDISQFVERSRTQCDKAVTSQRVTVEDETRWFEHTKTCESRIGVPENIINKHDAAEGSYRTFHDHILINQFDIPFLNSLTQVRMTNPTMEEIEEFAHEIEKQLKLKVVEIA